MPPRDYIVEDERFERLIHRNAGPEVIWTGGRWTEGPAYLPPAATPSGPISQTTR